ncbi:MAG: hypothetical protein V3W31_01700 [Thermodesulfobacteriota bacterium]
MDINILFLIGIGVVALTCLSVVVYMGPHLKKMLTELCGTEERAMFWVAFSNVTFLLIPLLFAMGYEPNAGGGGVPVFSEVVTQLKYGLTGLAVSVIFLGVIVSTSIFSLVGGPEGRRS